MVSWSDLRFPSTSSYSYTSLLEDPRVSNSVRRTRTFYHQHQPFVFFLALCAFVLVCMQLPWASSAHIGSYTGHASSQIAENGTIRPGSGTISLVPTIADGAQPQTGGAKARYAKVAVASGFEDILYERALETHVQHALRHGYPLYLAREQAANGMFNKIAYIINILLTELYKPAEDRVEWLFYFDVDSVIMNREIPLEIFDTPSDYQHINWIAAKDWNGLNAGVFLLRVCPWSLDLLSRTMTHKHYHPKEDYTFEEQSILARLTEKDPDFKDQSVYVPKSWINAYFYSMHEVKPGLLLSHFPHPDYKWHIYEWLKVIEDDLAEKYKPTYNKPVHETDYPEEIKRFWNVKRRFDKAMKGFQRNIGRGADPIQFGLQYNETKKLAEDFRGKYDKLKNDGPYKTDDPKELDKMITEAEEANAKLISELMVYFESHDDPPRVAGFRRALLEPEDMS